VKTDSMRFDPSGQNERETNSYKIIDREPNSYKINEREPNSYKIIDREPNSYKIIDREPNSFKINDRETNSFNINDLFQSFIGSAAISYANGTEEDDKEDSTTELDSHANMPVVRPADVKASTPDYDSMQIHVLDAALKYECLRHVHGEYFPIFQLQNQQNWR
jgi:hypothetical protein